MRIPFKTADTRQGLGTGTIDERYARTGGIGTAMEQFGQALTEINDARDKNDLVNASFEFERGMLQINDKYSQDTDLATVADRRKKDVDAMRERILGSVSRRVRNSLEQRFMLGSEESEIRFRGEVTKKDAEIRIARGKAQEDWLVNGAIMAGSEEEYAAWTSKAGAYLETLKPFLSPADYERKRNEVEDSILMGRARKRIEASGGLFNESDYRELDPDKVFRLQGYAETVRNRIVTEGERAERLAEKYKKKIQDDNYIKLETLRTQDKLDTASVDAAFQRRQISKEDYKALKRDLAEGDVDTSGGLDELQGVRSEEEILALRKAGVISAKTAKAASAHLNDEFASRAKTLLDSVFAQDQMSFDMSRQRRKSEALARVYEILAEPGKDRGKAAFEFVNKTIRDQEFMNKINVPGYSGPYNVQALQAYREQVAREFKDSGKIDVTSKNVFNGKVRMIDEAIKALDRRGGE